MEEITKGNLEKLFEKTTKTTEFNFWVDAAGAGIDDIYVETPLSIATLTNNAEMFDLLVENGAHVDFRLGEPQQWKTCLHLAAQHNKPLILKKLLKLQDADIYDFHGLTPLFYACTAGNSECVARLLLAGAKTDVHDSVGKSPLHQACLSNLDCIVLLLIDFGADVTHRNVAGNTPLHVAATRNSRESCKWLLIRGADITSKNKSGKTCLDLAHQALSSETTLLLQTFSPSDIIPPPPKLEDQLDNSEKIVQHVLGDLSDSIGKDYSPSVLPGQTPNPPPKKRPAQERQSTQSSSLKRTSEEGKPLSYDMYASTGSLSETEVSASPSQDVFSGIPVETPAIISSMTASFLPKKPSRLSKGFTEEEVSIVNSQIERQLSDVDPMVDDFAPRKAPGRRMSTMATSILSKFATAGGATVTEKPADIPRVSKDVNPYEILQRLRISILDPTLVPMLDELQSAFDNLKSKELQQNEQIV